MLIGIVGAPNKGKSTLFSAMTMNEVTIADYPFTTIQPNLGVAYATRKCVHEEFNTKCNARNSLCINGTRMFPINVIDVAGLVEGAHEGKGMGNQFLNDIAAADCLIIVADASGKTDPAGNKTLDANPTDDIKMVNEELVHWLAGIVKKHISAITRSNYGADALYEVLAGFKTSKQAIEASANAAGLSTNKPNWTDENILAFSRELIKNSKPSVIAANKSDVAGSEKNITALQNAFGKEVVIACSGAIELALRKAAKAGVVTYTAGASSFSLADKNPSQDRLNAIKQMENFLKTHGGTNVQELINRAAFSLLDNIVVYPVEDENKCTDHFGNVLPDGIMLKRGSTALDLAERIHTNIAKSMLYAIDARSRRRLSKEYILNDNDVVKIVSAAK